MKSVFTLHILAILGCFFLTGCQTPERRGEPRILLFTNPPASGDVYTAAATAAILKLGRQHQFVTDTASDASRFTEDSLRQYATVVFLGSSGRRLNHYRRADFERFIQAGAGFVGIGATPDSTDGWPWYARLAGAPVSGAGSNGAGYPLSWQHDFDGGRSWSTEMEYTTASWTDSLFLQQVLAGIRYAIGGNRLPDYTRAHTVRVPEENRFTKIRLLNGLLSEPTQMTVLPNLDVLIAQRQGDVLLYRHASNHVQRAGSIRVGSGTAAAGFAATGLLGIQADPDFASNHFVYLFYSPADTAAGRLSRFVIRQDSLDPGSEKIVLQTARPRGVDIGPGGYLAFGRDHNLFILTGDGRDPYNRILRIKIRPDGLYSIPKGNPSAGSGHGTDPQIHFTDPVHPCCIVVNKENDFLYPGEAGAVYHTVGFADSTRYPDYFDNKLFLCDRTAGRIKLMSLMPDGRPGTMEPFMEHSAFYAPIGLEAGPDGRLYVLEYGDGSLSGNTAAGLSVIRYNAGNRPPEIGSLTTARNAGPLPFRGSVQVAVRDPENDVLAYTWNFGNGLIKETSIPEAEFNYTSAGDYQISVTVRDIHGAAASSAPLTVYAGREPGTGSEQAASKK